MPAMPPPLDYHRPERSTWYHRVVPMLFIVLAALGWGLALLVLLALWAGW